MKINDNFYVYNGDMREILSKLNENTIDSIITDPPYELNFMNKGWDNAGVSFNKETWEKCFKVLKPGGYLLAFGGSRTYHRIAVAIEDAGFEIRDTIMWLYGCYSSDTQVLTDKGWKYFYDLDKTEKILQWDSNKDSLSWVKPLNYFEYEIDDEMILLQNRHTEQLITKNHTVYAKVQKNIRKQEKGIRKIISNKDESYTFYKADELKNSWGIELPLASKLEGNVDCEYAYMLGWWFTDAWKHKDGKACMFSQSKPDTLIKLKAELDRLKELGKCNYSEYIKESKNENHKPEHTFYVTGDLADYLLANYNDRELDYSLLNFTLECKYKLLDGLMDGDGSVRKNGYSKVFWTQKESRRDIVSALLTCMGYRNNIFCEGRHQGVLFNINHSSSEVSYKHRKPLQKYSGKVYCLETETGAFIVRRNGKPFISGNSGFPKSMNIGLAIDKRNGVESKVVGYKDTTMPDFRDVGEKQKEISGIDKMTFGQVENSKRKAQPIYEPNNEWSGWGTCLKPAFEPVIIARKPFKGSCVDNVLQYGVGGLNIDECRVPANPGEYDIRHYTNEDCFQNLKPKESKFQVKPQPEGRFPANVILTYDESDFDEVCGGMPTNKKANGSIKKSTYKDSTGDSGIYSKYSESVPLFESYQDSGSAARYFYCAKASRRDRDEGLEDSIKKNTHPTVKPTSLLSYLIRLVTPKNGIILDPFMGSGSTGKAVAYENKDRGANYKFIGVELTDEYIPIAMARIEYALDKGE